MNIFIIILFLWINSFHLSSCSSCLPCSSPLCYQCDNQLPKDRINIEKLTIQCNTTNDFLQNKERFYSIIQSYTIINCTIKTFYLDQYTQWNYLEYLSIIYANLTRLSSMIFNRSSSLPILYSLKTLNLSHNSIRSLNKNFSYSFPSLEKLDLSYNKLSHIKIRTFTNLIYLKELYLNNNYLKNILSNIFPSQSLYLINLNMNSWHCSCTNVLTLSISQPIPSCSTPNYFQNQNASDIARQCFLRTKANILLTMNMTQKQNLTCVLSTIINEWESKITTNITLISAWHIEQRRSISFEYLSTFGNNTDKHLICFNFNSSHPESIDRIIPLSSFRLPLSVNYTTTPLLSSTSFRPTPPSLPNIPSFFLWFYKTSKILLPKYFQKSDKYVLIIWLILLTFACLILISLVYYVHYRKADGQCPTNPCHSFIRIDKTPSHPRTLFNLKLTCQNHKCLCQYRRRAHSTLYLTKSLSSNSHEKQSLCIQPSYIEPNQLRYAKIKRLSSTNDYLTGEFRTIIKFK